MKRPKGVTILAVLKFLLASLLLLATFVFVLFAAREVLGRDKMGRELTGMLAAVYVLCFVVPHLWSYYSTRRRHKHLLRLAELTQLHYRPKEEPFAEKGAVIGARDGYLIAAGPVSGSSDRRQEFRILVRFTGLEEVLKERLKQLSKDRGWKIRTKVSLMSAPEHSESGRCPLSAVLWSWRYSFTPKPEAVAERLEAMLAAVKEVARPLDGHCEVCQVVSSAEITVYYEMLSYQCSGCKERLRLEAEAAQREYDAVPGNFARGLILGLVAALVDGIAWAWAASIWGERTVLATTCIGILVSFAVTYGTGKASRSERMLARALAVVGAVAGVAFYYGTVPLTSPRVPPILVLLSAAGFAFFGAHLTMCHFLEDQFHSRWLLSRNKFSSNSLHRSLNLPE